MPFNSTGICFFIWTLSRLTLSCYFNRRLANEDMKWKWGCITHLSPRLCYLQLLVCCFPSNAVLFVKSVPDICISGQFASLQFLLGYQRILEYLRRTGNSQWLRCIRNDRYMISALSVIKFVRR